MNFNSVLRNKEGNVYFEEVYTTTYKNEELKKKGEEGKQQYFYCSVNAKDLNKKDKLLKITKPIVGYVDPNQID